VPGGVAVERIVAAKGRAALLAGAQMDPTGAHFHAFFALVALRPLDFFDGADMGTAFVTHRLPLLV
jgi:hypothetical protein